MGKIGVKSAEPRHIPLKRLSYFIIPARIPAAGATGKEQTAIFPFPPTPPFPPDCCRLPRIMHAEIREKESETMKGERKI